MISVRDIPFEAIISYKTQTFHLYTIGVTQLIVAHLSTS